MPRHMDVPMGMTRPYPKTKVASFVQFHYLLMKLAACKGNTIHNLRLKNIHSILLTFSHPFLTLLYVPPLGLVSWKYVHPTGNKKPFFPLVSSLLNSFGEAP